MRKTIIAAALLFASLLLASASASAAITEQTARQVALAHANGGAKTLELSHTTLAVAQQHMGEQGQSSESVYDVVMHGIFTARTPSPEIPPLKGTIEELAISDTGETRAIAIRGGAPVAG